MEEFKPENAEAKLRSQRNAEAMLNLADEITQEFGQAPDSQPQLEPEPEEKIIRTKERVKASTAREQAKSRLPMGPKYMEALNHVTSVADIRAIESELPILKTKVEVTPLTGAEEQALKTAAVSPESFLKKLDELLFYHVKFQNIKFESYNQFLSNLFPPDKSILIWALLSATYLVLPTMEKECESCGESYLVDATPSDLIHDDTITKIWDSELPPSEDRVIQSALDGYLVFELGMPSERDKLVVAKLLNPEQAKDNISQTGGLLSYTDNLIFFTKTIIVGEGDERIVLTDLIQDIAPFLRNLPPKVADAVKNQIDLDLYGDYMPVFYLNTTCTKCGNQERIDVDPEIAFFRKAVSL
jgi:hypothetical protein